MKCPLLAIAWGSLASKEMVDYPECLKEKCAFWDKNNAMCSALSLATRLMNISIALNEVVDKMPYKEELLGELEEIKAL